MICKEPFKVVCPFDPAIDVDRVSLDDAVQYGHTRDFEAISRFFKPGVEPMVFHLRPIAASLVPWVRAGTNDTDRNERAFAACCFHIDGLWNPDRTRIAWTAQGADMPDTHLTQAEMERIPPVCRQDIGQVALTRCLFLVPWSAPKYVLPDGSALLLVQRHQWESSAAESQMRSTANGTETSSRTSDASGTEIASGGEPSAGPTAVPAMEPATG